MNKQQITAYHEIMDYIARQNYKGLMKEKRDQLSFTPSFDMHSRIKVLGYDKRLDNAISGAISKNQLSADEVYQLGCFVKRSSLHVTESSLSDLYLPQFLTILGLSVLMMLFYVFFINDCMLGLSTTELNQCLKAAAFKQQVFTYLIGIIIAVFAWAAVRRRSILLAIVNNKLLISEHLINTSRK